MTETKAPERAQYANYWENDQVLNPKLVNVLSQDGDYYHVRLPNGEGVKQVHLHTLGNVHRVY